MLRPPSGSGAGKHVLLGSLSRHLMACPGLSRLHHREVAAQWGVCVKCAFLP